MSTETKVIAKIKNVQILVNQDSEKRVAIKPICEILGIDFSAQLKKLKDDLIIGSTVVLSTTVASDGNSRNMQTLPFKYIFPWLLKINAKNVKQEAREELIKYQNLCYDVLYNYFVAKAEFIEIRQKQIEEQLDVVTQAKTNFKGARTVLNEAENKLTKIRKFTFEDYQAQQNQTSINFEEEQE
jgi:hypothetical protein